ncbi:hypothetical protein BDA96_10G099700 [Sorghum bicolor]|uniref:Uncharacterized protein n=1 Tax=Sorghum bicolor TaxID=4558 RepID=A0A921Q0G6_SORBI|nr:hypothetical protein BDA96_10G099700 [Sorghum bicolor]
MQEQNQSNSLSPKSKSSQCRRKGRCATGLRSCSARQTSDGGERRQRHGSTDAALTQATAALFLVRSGRQHQQPRSQPSQRVRDVPERREPRGHQPAGVAEQDDLGQGALVVRPRLRVLVLVVASLVHRDNLGGRRRVGVVHAVQLVLVLRFQEDHQHGLGLGRRAVRRPGTRFLGVGHLWQKVMLPRAPSDLLVHDLERELKERREADLYAEKLVGAGEVAVVEPLHDPPRSVPGVEEIHLPRWWNTDAFAGNIRSSSVRWKYVDVRRQRAGVAAAAVVVVDDIVLKHAQVVAVI